MEHLSSHCETDRDGTRSVVVMLDDDVHTLAVVGRLLGDSGYRVESFTDGETCLAGLGRVSPDAICLDLHLPGYQGTSFLRRLRELVPDVPVVMLTGDDRPESVVTSMREGAYDYVTKPVGPDRLLTTIAHAVAERRLVQQVRSLERELGREGYGPMLGRSAAMLNLFRQLERVEGADMPLLLHGEVGSGKGLTARTVHERSRRQGPLVEVSLSTTPEPLQAALLFGYARGSARGGAVSRRGLLDEAAGGTLLLRDVEELGDAAQAGLLGALERRAFRRVGGSALVPCGVRLIATTARDLGAEVAAGRFREALYFRMRGFDIHVPPLRERPEDVLPLATDVLRRYAAESGMDRPATSLKADAVRAILEYPWPGNARELSNAMQRAAIVAGGRPIVREDLPPYVLRGESPPRSPLAPQDVPVSGDRMSAIQRRAIAEALTRSDGNVSAAARELGMGRATLYRKMKAQSGERAGGA